MAAATRWTVERVRALPDDRNRYEVIDGELYVSPAPTWRHQAASRQLFLLLDAYVVEHGIGDALYAPADIAFDDENMVEPDIFVVPRIDGRRALAWEDVRRLLLAVEILSPGTARADRQAKRRLYQRQGVPEYRIVDLDARVIERWQPEDERPEILAQRMEWRPEAAHPPLVIDLERYFAAVHGE
jgi:Uma2 family endonuclease